MKPPRTLGFYFLSTLLATVTSLADSSPAAGRFIRVADQATPLPGGLPDETFATFSGENFDPPRVSERCLAFMAQGDKGTVGLYLVENGAISVVADTHTLLPAGLPGEVFGTFEESFALDVCDVVFDAKGSDETRGTRGIYLKRHGSPLELVADHQTPAPAGIFEDFEDPWLESGRIVFLATTRGGGCEALSLYQKLGSSFSLIADACGGTGVPGGLDGETFTNLESRPVLEDGVLSFGGLGDQSTDGLYSEIDGELLVVADTNTPIAIPGAEDTVFSAFLKAAPTSRGDTVFLGAGWEPEPPFSSVGLFRRTATGLELVIDLLDPPPLPGWSAGDSISFDDEDFPQFWFHGELITLGVSGSLNPSTLFLLTAGEITRLIGAGDRLDGEIVTDVDHFPHTGGDRIVFIAHFEDGGALYLVDCALFRDGFESGDVTRWSSSVG